MLFDRFFFGWEGSPTKIDCRRKKTGTLILTSLLEDLVSCGDRVWAGVLHGKARGSAVSRQLEVCVISRIRRWLRVESILDWMH